MTSERERLIDKLSDSMDPDNAASFVYRVIQEAVAESGEAMTKQAGFRFDEVEAARLEPMPSYDERQAAALLTTCQTCGRQWYMTKAALLCVACLRQRDFDGATYEAGRDHDRLFAQLAVVRSALADGGWYTLPQLEAATGHPQASISARMRDLRKPKFGGHTVERQYLSGGLWAYRLVMPIAKA